MAAADISSPKNERIKRLVRLRDRDERDSEGVFVVEGDRLFRRANESGLEPIEVYVAPDHPMADSPETLVVEAAALDRASYRERSEGIIAVYQQPSPELGSIETGDNPLVVIVENVEKPGNLGAILRTAEAAGATALVAIGSTVDFFNPNVLRASTGAVFTQPIATAGLAELAAWAKERHLQLVVATPDAAAPYWAADLSGPVAIIVGAEDEGVTQETRAHADRLVSVPMSGSIDSLNVSVTAALLLFEAIRQRAMQGR